MSALYLAALADLTLSGFIFVIWRLLPEERHAAFWAAGFALIGAAVGAYGFMVAGKGAALPVIASVLVSFGLALLWGGTRERLSKATSLRRIGTFAAVAVAALAAAGFVGTPAGDRVVLALMCGTFLWCAWKLACEVPQMRLAAAAFGIRGVFLATLLAGGKIGDADGMFYLTMISRALFAVALVCNLIHETLRRWRESEALRHAATHAAAARLNSVIESLGDCLYVRDARGHIVMANSACARMLGFDDVASLVGRPVTALFAGMTEEALAEENARVHESGQQDGAPRLHRETELERIDGRRLPVELRLAPFRFEDGQHPGPGVLAHMRDITERRQYEQRLLEQVTVDEVTQLPNRRMLMERLRQAIAMGRRGGGACAVMMIDLDHFKRINETRGHTLGDALLARAAQRLRDTLREADTVARFGGDEFVVVLTEANAGGVPLRVEYAAQRVVESFHQPFVFEEMEVVTTASVGIAIWPGDGDDPDTLVRNADTAMYEVKKSTRNGFCLFNREMNVRVQNVLRIDAQLRGALEAGQFRLVFQPIVDAVSHRMMKVEALLRWRSAALGDVPPDHFIPVAEETGQINAIGAWVLEQSCRQLLALQAARLDGAPLTMSVNISARQLADPSFAATVGEILSRTGMPPNQLELELTERILIDDNPAVTDAISTLRQMGVSLSLDDFGTGYSSLSYLTRFSLSTVKLDRSFVRDIESNPQSLLLATAVIAMCRSLGLALVAEGVETVDQAQLLRHHGCRFLQGYYFGRPVSAEEVVTIPGFQCEAITGGAAA